jgi:hypothetical protein
MTAEIGVLNRSGVALAADSAVTVGRDANKIYTSAEKLFQLSTVAPVGVMIYGNATFVGLPWETIIKSFRRQLRNVQLDTIQNYADKLLTYLTNNQELFPDATQAHHVATLIASLFLSVRDQIRERLDREAEQRDGLSDDDLPQLIDSILKERLAIIRTREMIEGFNDNIVDMVRENYRETISDLRKEIFGNLPMSEESVNTLSVIAVEMLTRLYFGPLKSGLVIAGFGEREYLPALVSYELEEIVLGLPRKRLSETAKIDDSSDAVIVPFAQREPVYQFLEGIDESLETFMHRTTENVLTGAVDIILSKLATIDQQMASPLSDSVKPEIRKLLEGLFQQWQTRKHGYLEPVLNVVAALPKDELAAMAEALVNLTKFRRRVTPERETVGGPSDVAVITKGDGFVWIRRKHYFDPNLNPRIMARYTKGD